MCPLFSATMLQWKYLQGNSCHSSSCEEWGCCDPICVTTYMYGMFPWLVGCLLLVFLIPRDWQGASPSNGHLLTLHMPLSPFGSLWWRFSGCWCWGWGDEGTGSLHVTQMMYQHQGPTPQMTGCLGFSVIYIGIATKGFTNIMGKAMLVWYCMDDHTV